MVLWPKFVLTFFVFFRPTQKMGPDGPKWAQEDFFPTNPDLADILGRTDFDFENFFNRPYDFGYIGSTKLFRINFITTLHFYLAAIPLGL